MQGQMGGRGLPGNLGPAMPSTGVYRSKGSVNRSVRAMMARACMVRDAFTSSTYMELKQSGNSGTTSGTRSSAPPSPPHPRMRRSSIMQRAEEV